jgi:predicted phage tail protein
MLVLIYTSKFSKTYDIEISNLLQLKDYLCVNDAEVWSLMKDMQMAYVVGDSTEKLKEQILYKNMLKTSITSYDTLVICEKIEGEFIATLTAFLAIQLVLMGMGGFAAVMTATVVTGLLVMGAVYGLGQLLMMLVPTPNMGNNDPSKKKDLMFNGIPNIAEQGGSVPLIFGECLFGGVLIGNTLTTVGFKVGSSFTADANIPLVASVSATTTKVPNNDGTPKNVVESEWYRVG